LVATSISGVFSLIHARATVSFRADHVVRGIAINFSALGIGVFSTKEWYANGQTDTISKPFYTMNAPLIPALTAIGTMLITGVYATSYLAIILAFVAWYVLYKTAFGLRLRAVGEHPMAADTNGVNVYLMRYIAVFISGLLGGLGGSVFALTIAFNFSASTIVGQGFMSL